VKVVYLSLTGKTRQFVKKLNWDFIEISRKNPTVQMEEPYIVITPTYGEQVANFFYEFIDFGENRALLKGVAGSGNRNFNTSFCSNARALAVKYEIPLLHCFENQGTDKDVQILIEKVREIG
jgi:nrdI protein